MKVCSLNKKLPHKLRCLNNFFSIYGAISRAFCSPVEERTSLVAAMFTSLSPTLLSLSVMCI